MPEYTFSIRRDYVRSIGEIVTARKTRYVLRVDCRCRRQRFMGITALFLEERSSATGRSPICEKLSCLQGATKKNSMMPGGGKLPWTSRSAKLAALTQKLSRSITAGFWPETSTRRWGVD